MRPDERLCGGRTAELGIEYPRHVVTALTERGKHEYAVRLESLGRAKDMDTKRYSALSLYRAGLKLSTPTIADLLGVAQSVVVKWIQEAKAKEKIRQATQAAAEQGSAGDTPSQTDQPITDDRLPPGLWPTTTIGADGRERPAERPVKLAEPLEADPSPDDDDADDDESPSFASVSDDGSPAADEPERQTVGDVMSEIAEQPWSRSWAMKSFGT